MSIRYGEQCLSGWSRHPFETSAARLLEFDTLAKIVSIRAVEEESTGRATKIVIPDDSSVARTAAVAQLDFGKLEKLECKLQSAEIPVALHPWLYRTTVAGQPATDIDGLVYLDALLNRVPAPEPGLHALASVVATLARHLDAGGLSVTSDDDDSLRLPNGLRLPSVFAVFPRAFLDGLIPSLAAKGAVVEESSAPDYLVVWPASIASLLDDGEPRWPVLQLLKPRLASVS